MFCLVDGSVRFIAESIDSWQLSQQSLLGVYEDPDYAIPEAPRVYQHLSTRAGGEAVGTDW